MSPGRPRVLVTLAGDGAQDPGHVVRERHLAMLRGAGLLPVPVAGTLSDEEVAELAALCACAYLPGTDYVPCREGEPEDESLAAARAVGLPFDRFKLAADRAVIAIAWERRMPLLGICGGMQAMVVHAGGTLRAARGDELATHAEAASAAPAALEPGSLAARAAAGPANSFHRQVVATVAPPLVASGVGSDGVVEAVEAPSDVHPFWLGLQWHPERAGDEGPYRALAAAVA